MAERKPDHMRPNSDGMHVGRQTFHLCASGQTQMLGFDPWGPHALLIFLSGDFSVLGSRAFPIWLDSTRKKSWPTAVSCRTFCADVLGSCLLRREAASDSIVCLFVALAWHSRGLLRIPRS